MTAYETKSPSPRTRSNFEIDSLETDRQQIEGLTKLLKHCPTSGVRGTTTVRLSISLSTPQLLELFGRNLTQ